MKIKTASHDMRGERRSTMIISSTGNFIGLKMLSRATTIMCLIWASGGWNLKGKITKKR